MPQFNQVVPLLKRPRYEEGTRLSSTRDDRNNSFLWKKGIQNSGQIDGSTQGLEKLSRQFAQLRRRPMGGYQAPEIPAASVGSFQIYNVANATDPSLNNFTFQIRPGLIGFRPSVYGTAGLALQTIDAIQENCYGNFEVPLIGSGTDNNYEGAIYEGGGIIDANYTPTPNTGGSITLPSDGTPMLISSVSPAVSQSMVQIVIPYIAPDFFGSSLAASFWLLIKEDSTNGCYTELWGAASQFVYPLFPTQYASPDASIGRTVPIGLVFYADVTQPTEFEITQFQDGSLFNRYAEKSPFSDTIDITASYGVPQVFRGFNSKIPVARVDGSNNYRIYYPGDIVIDDSIYYAMGSLNCYASFVYTNFQPDEESQFTGGAPFLPAGVVPVGV